MSLIVDESVILRYLLADDQHGYRRASEAVASGEACTYPEVFARVAVVLRDVYGVPRSQIGYALTALMDDIHVIEAPIVEYASRLFGSSMLDYVDCLLIARNALMHQRVMTFDKPLLSRMLMVWKTS